MCIDACIDMFTAVYRHVYRHVHIFGCACVEANACGKQKMAEWVSHATVCEAVDRIYDCVGMTYRVMAYIVMAYIVMASIVQWCPVLASHPNLIVLENGTAVTSTRSPTRGGLVILFSLYLRAPDLSSSP